MMTELLGLIDGAAVVFAFVILASLVYSLAFFLRSGS